MIVLGVSSSHSGGGGGHDFGVPDSSGSSGASGASGLYEGIKGFFRSISEWWDSVLKKEDSHLKDNWKRLNSELDPAGKFGFILAFALVLFVGFKLIKRYLLKKFVRWL